MDNPNLLGYILSFIIGGCTIYVSAYLKEKGKNNSLKEDISQIESEKQSIIAKSKAEVEKLKKEHSLDIEKRKYQYEDKRKQFSKYFELIDIFHGNSTRIYKEKFQPIMNEFFSLSIDEDINQQQLALEKFNDGIRLLFNEIYDEQLKLSTETNSIRLISSPAIDALLDELNASVEEATNHTSEMIKFMGTPDFWVDQSLVQPYKQAAELAGRKSVQIKDDLREQMKRELDEI